VASPAAVLEIFVNAQTGAASSKLTKFNSQMKASELQADRSSKAIGGKFAKAAKTAGIAAGALAAYGLYKAVSVGAEFEKQMDALGAVSGATARQMKRLEQQALDLGESTAFTANEVAKAQIELAKGGLSVKQIASGGLKAALSLAAAGELELAEAAETTVNSMKLFSLGGKDAGQIADMLATAANKTTADVSDFAMALKQGGSVAKLAGLNLNNTVTILEALAESGIKNSDAGTSMKTSFIQLLKPTEKQAKLAELLGIQWTTQAGTIKTAAGLSKELREATDGMTKAERAKTLATLAGTDGVRTLNALYDAGPAKLKGFEQANRKVGTAQDIARQKMDNLSGDAEQLTGALETQGVKLSRLLSPALRTATQWLTHFIQNLDGLDVNQVAHQLGIGQKELKQFGEAGRNAAAIFNKFVWPVVKSTISMIIKLLQDFALVVRGVVRIISGILTGDFGEVWRGVKDIFRGGVDGAIQILRGATKPLRMIAAAIGEGIGKAFGAAWDGIKGIFVNGANDVIDKVNSIIGVLEKIPGVPDIGKVGRIGENGGGGKISSPPGIQGPVGRQNRYSGGAITKPMAIVGEEAPRHHEWVIATNPAYKKANLGYWAQAGADLGVPGFATGGLLGKAAGAASGVIGSVVGKGAGYFIGKLPKPDIPPPFAGVGPYLIEQVSEYIKSGFDQGKFGSLIGLGGSGKKLMEEISKQKHWNFADWWALDAAETSHGANLSNPTSSARLRGQFLDMNYGKYGTGSDPAKNPSMSQQIVAMARYISERYGNPSKAWAFHQAHNYYARGGLMGGVSSPSGTPTSGNPFNSKAMRATVTTPPPMEMLSASGYEPRTIERIKAKAQQIASAFTGYVWGGGHGEGNNVTANGLDCSAAVAKLMQQSGFNFPVAVSGDYASRFMPGAGDLFTIWSNADHTFANIEGKDWGTNTSNGLGYATHTHSGFTPVHPALADSDAHSFKEDVPAVYKGARTGSLNIPSSVPKSLPGINKELGKRRAELKRSRAAAADAHKKGKPKIEHEITGNIRELEARIRELERAQAKERREAAKRKITKKFGKQLGKLTGFEDLIAAKERSFDGKSQFAEQLVALEPVMPEVPEKATEAQREAVEKGHLENLSRYIETQEEPAYRALLGSAGEWRDTILLAQEKAAGHWQKGKTLGGLEGRWEDRIIAIGQEIDHDNDFIKKAGERVQTWRQKHGNDPFPDWLKDQVKKQHELRAELPILKFKENELRKNLGKGRSMFYPGKGRIKNNPGLPFEGSGSLEEALTNVQGIHWPSQHEKIATLPASRVAGEFGGVIWDVQSSIAELGMKIRDARVGGGGAGGQEDSGDSDRLAFVEEKLRQANQRDAVDKAQRVALEGWDAARKGYAGMFGSGGSIPAGMWGIAGERGPEPIFGPTTVVSNRDAQGVFGGSGGSHSVEVNVFEGEGRAEVLIDGKTMDAIVNHRKFAPAAQQAARSGRPIGISTPGGPRH